MEFNVEVEVLKSQSDNFIHDVGRIKNSSSYTTNCYWERNILHSTRLRQQDKSKCVLWGQPDKD